MRLRPASKLGASNVSQSEMPPDGCRTHPQRLRELVNGEHAELLESIGGHLQTIYSTLIICNPSVETIARNPSHLSCPRPSGGSREYRRPAPERDAVVGDQLCLLRWLRVSHRAAPKTRRARANCLVYP